MRLFRSTPADLLWTLATLGLLLAWQASGLDLPLARPWATAQGFALRDHWLLSTVLHDGAARVAWLPCLWLVLGIWWPTGILQQLGRAQRVQWAATTLLALALISLLKQASHTGCPWDLAQFGGQGGGGHCFPAGHASAGFAFISGYFALRARHARHAWAWLAGSIAAGLVLGGAQQLRGAHFMSHTAWTAWLCWTLAWLSDIAGRRFRARTAQRRPGLYGFSPPGRF